LDRQFENLAIVLDRFEELPVIVAANMVMEDNTLQVYRVAVVDKKLGKLRFARSLDPNGTFLATVTDPKSGATEYIRYNSRLVITPDAGDSAPPPADKPKPAEPAKLAK